MTGRGQSLLLVLVGSVAVGTLMTPALAATPVSGRFTDDDDHPEEVYLERLAELGVVHGCNSPANTLVCPDEVIGRGEAARSLVGAAQHRAQQISRAGNGDRSKPLIDCRRGSS